MLFFYKKGLGQIKCFICDQYLSLIGQLVWESLCKANGEHNHFIDSCLVLISFPSDVLTVCRLFETQLITMAVYSSSLRTASPVFEPWSTVSVDGDVLQSLSSVTEENSTAERCYLSHSRSSVLQGLPFGGVPTVLTINLVLWLVQYFFFSQLLFIYMQQVLQWVQRPAENRCVFFCHCLSFYTRRFNSTTLKYSFASGSV